MQILHKFIPLLWRFPGIYFLDSTLPLEGIKASSVYNVSLAVLCSLKVDLPLPHFI